MVTPAASKDVAASGDLAAQDLQLNERWEGHSQQYTQSIVYVLPQVRQALPVLSRMLRPALQSALAALGAHLGYNVLGGLAVLFTSAAALLYWFPGTLGHVGLVPGWLGGGNQTDEDSVGARFEAVLRRYNVDPDACLKVAMCSVGRVGASSSFPSSEGASSAQAHGKQRRQAGPVEVFDSMLSLTFMDEVLLSRSLRTARQLGEAGGDCDAFNRAGKCPFNAAAWKVRLSAINRSLA
ncbi:uncharacterized protein LOC144163711 [Haemaphysalis longicornis]